MRTGLAVIFSYVDAWSRDFRFGRVVYHDPRGTRRRLGARRESENPYISSNLPIKCTLSRS